MSSGRGPRDTVPLHLSVIQGRFWWVWMAIGACSLAGGGLAVRNALATMNLLSRFSFCVAGVLLMAGPLSASPLPGLQGQDVPGSLPFSSEQVWSGPACATVAAQTAAPKAVDPREAEAAVDLRMASRWLGAAFRIPSRVPEEMFYAGHTYADVVIALNLMDQGASLNEVLEQREHMRWKDVVEAVNVPVGKLPRIVRRMIRNDQYGLAPAAIRFVPDVRSSLSDRLRLPRFAATIPDRVSVERFRLNKDEVANVRLVFDHMEDLTPEMLRLPAGRSLTTADWVIAATLAKYQPFPIETLLATRTGEVVEWGDVAGMFGTDPVIFVSGPLAPIYAVLSGVGDNCIIPTLKRPSYPAGVDQRYCFDDLSDTELDALRWLMGMYYRENANEYDLIKARHLPLAEQAMVLSVARMAFVPVREVLDLLSSNLPWDSIVAKYRLDLTGEDVFAQAVVLRSPTKVPPVNDASSEVSMGTKAAKGHGTRF